MCADLLNLGRDIGILERSGVELFHVDVMDGHFVKNFGLPYDLIRAVKRITTLPLDVHLAVDNPEVHVPLACEAGADIVTFHPETAGNVAALAGEIHARGKLACFAVAPACPLEALDPVLDVEAGVGSKGSRAPRSRPMGSRPDFLNLLMVKPGFAGQAIIPSTKEKLKQLKERLTRYAASRGISQGAAEPACVPVMVDGNVSAENIPWMVRYGADVLILGTSGLFRKGANLEEGVSLVRALVEGALREADADGA
jgi:ribulose-phosphate 3-epimerase